MKQWKLKDNVKFEALEKYGYRVLKHGACKYVKRNKRNDVEIYFDMYRDLHIVYYDNMKIVGNVKYRHNKFLKDLINADLVEAV